MFGLLTGILGAKGGSLLETGLKVVDELYDSPEEKRQAEITLEKIEAKLKEKQIQINIEQAKLKTIYRIQPNQQSMSCILFFYSI